MAHGRNHRREPAATLAERVRCPRRGGLRYGRGQREPQPGAADRGTGAALRPTRAGKRGAKKGLEPLSVAEQHAMIADLHASYPQLSVRRLCALLGTGRTWYYRRPTAAERAARDTALRDASERVVLEFPGYGYRRVTRALQREGWDVNHKRVLRVLREEALLCQLKRRFVVTTD